MKLSSKIRPFILLTQTVPKKRKEGLIPPPYSFYKARVSATSELHKGNRTSNIVRPIPLTNTCKKLNKY